MTLPLLKVDDSTVQFNFDRIAAALQGPGIPRIVSGGAKDISTSQSTTSTSYTTLTTPDTVTITLPTKGLVAVWYQAIWQNTVASNARAAIFLGSTQVALARGTGAALAQEVNGPAETNDDAVLGTTAGGLVCLAGVGNATEVTTGQIVSASNSGLGGPEYIFAAAGTYDVSVKFKNNAAGTLTAKNRHLWVAAFAFN